MPGPRCQTRRMDTLPEASTPEIVRREPVPTAVVRGSVRMDEIASFFDRAYPLVASVLEQQGVQPLEAFGYYLSPPADTIELEAGFTTGSPVTVDGDVVASSLPGGDAARLTHVGPYDGLAQTWAELGRWMDEHGHRPAQAFWEVYVTQPSPDADPASMRTDIYWLLDS